MVKKFSTLFPTLSSQNTCFVHINAVDNVNNSVNNLYKLVSSVDKPVVSFMACIVFM